MNLKVGQKVKILTNWGAVNATVVNFGKNHNNVECALIKYRCGHSDKVEESQIPLESIFVYLVKEWTAIYVDECGDRQILKFATYEQATQFLESCDFKIGVVKTDFYDRYLA